MKERPIIMSYDSVRAILDGRKSMTRRVVKYIPRLGSPKDWCKKIDDSHFERIVGDYRRFSPYGQVGDRLWVKEVWRDRFGTAYANYGTGNAYPIDDIREVDYKSGGNGYFIGGCIFRDDELSAKWAEWSKWKSPLFMPRWASRLVLEITYIRVERLQDITEEDAMAEGVKMGGGTAPEIGYSYRYGYSTLWDSLNAKRDYPWESNPWVWVVSFKVVQK